MNPSSRLTRQFQGLAAALLLFAAGPAMATTQTYNGDIVQIIVNDTASPTINARPSTQPAGAYIAQYCCGSSNPNGWGSVVVLNGSRIGSGYAASGFTAVSNTTNTIPGGTEVVTVVNVGSTGVQLTQKLTHMTGDRFVSKEWVLRNNGATTFTGSKFYHGGDTMFGGDDSASGFYDAAKSMVYVRNNAFNDWGIMGFYANPGTPADRYFEGNYSTGNSYASAGTDLPNTVLATYQDAGYYLQWNRATFAPGQVWTIQAFEIWTPGGGLQVLAPGTQNSAPNSTVTLPFTVQNLGATALNLNLAAAASAGWATTIQGGNTITVAANSSVSVSVNTVVPAGATGSSTVTLTVTGNASGTGVTTLNVVNVNMAVSPTTINFGTFAPNAPATPQQVTVTNQSGNPVTLGTLTALSPFGKASDTCSGVTLADGASCTVNATFATTTGGTYNSSLNIPVVAPVLVTRTVSLAGIVSTATSITASAGANGSLDASTPSPASVPPGGTHSFTFNASAGYHVASISGCGGTTYNNSLNTVTTYSYTTGVIASACNVAATFAINVYPTSVAVLSSANPSLPGGAVSFTANVTPSAAGGSIQFTIDGTNFGAPVALSGGSATSNSTSSLTIGNHAVTAVYSGNASYLGSTGTLTGGQDVLRYDSAVAIDSSPNPSTYGEAVLVTTTVTSAAGGTPGGLVTLLEGANVLDTQPLDGMGSATLTAGLLPGGTTELWVSYAGDTAHLPSMSLNHAQLVLPKPSQVLFTSGPSPSLFGSAITLTATVAGMPVGPSTPGGQVAFHEGATVLGIAPLVGGVATLTVSSFSVGPHALSASYLGDSRFLASDSSVASQVMTPSCVVGGTIYADGTVNPADPCLTCRAALSANSWSFSNDGAACGTDGLSCTTDVCNSTGTCEHRINAGCLVGGACVASGAVDPTNECRLCTPSTSMTSYSPKARRAECTDDGSPITDDFCDGVGRCIHPPRNECVIGGQVYPGGTQNPANSCQVCDVLSNDSGWTDRATGSPCATDDLSCTQDLCDGAGTCNHTLFVGCLIDGACISWGTADPANECKECNPSLTTAGYSNRARGVQCTDDNLANTLDICDGNAACVHPLRGQCVIGGVTFRANDANPANPCQSCDPASSVSVWTNRVGGFPCTADALGCTTDECDGAGACTHDLYTGCLMGGACIPSGATDPTNECLGCFPAVSSSTYTPKAMGVACTDDGLSNTADICSGTDTCVHPLLGECIINTVTYRAGVANPLNGCQSCQPAINISAWTDRVAGFPCAGDGLDCTSDVCDGTGICDHHLYTGCLIGGACVSGGATDPSNECQGCFPATSTNSYTSKARGVACTDDGSAITGDFCNGTNTCIHPLLGECIIDGVTYRSGTANPANICQSCEPSRSVSAWSDRVNGFPCTTDGLDCTSDVCNGTGTCTHPLYTGCLLGGACVIAGTTDPANDCNACDPAQSGTVYSPKPRGVACADDQLANTLDTCNGASTCTHEVAGQCNIGGTVLNAGATNPANPCQSCDPSSSVSAWTDRVAGFPCTSDGLDCTADVCNATGACEHHLATGCLLNGACVAEGTTDPALECQACVPAQSTTAFTAKPRGVACADDGQANTLDTCDGQGACAHVAGGQCSIQGVLFNAEAANPDNPCQVCDPAASVSAWTDRADGFPCTSDGLDCTSDVCGMGGVCEHRLFTGCLVDGSCVEAGGQNPANDCAACIPATATNTYSSKAHGVACADEGDATTLDQCNGSGTCLHLPGGECLINGVTVAAGAANPDNPCQACDASVAAFAWSNRADGFPCSTDGLDCTNDVCNATGACEHRLYTGCMVAGACVPEGATDPDGECRVCTAATSASGYSPKAMGTSCSDDGMPNTVDACDAAGACAHTLMDQCVIGGATYNGGAANPANACQWCNPATSATEWSNRASGYLCASDSLLCTSDVCDGAGVCGHTITTGCVIGGACVAANATNPADECQACIPGTSRTAYSAVAQSDACGATCAADAECGDGKFCQASVCRPAKVEGATCDANAQCSSGTCQEGVCAAAANTKSGCNCNASETDPTSAILAALVLGWVFRRHARR